MAVNWKGIKTRRIDASERIKDAPDLEHLFGDGDEAKGLDAILERSAARNRAAGLDGGRADLVAKLELMSGNIKEYPHVNGAAVRSAMANHRDWTGEHRDAFTAQLDRIDEAQRVINLAWQSGYFVEYMTLERSAILETDILDTGAVALTETVEAVTKAALSLLADQYPDLRVLVKRPKTWEQNAHKQKCWVKVLAAANPVQVLP